MCHQFRKCVCSLFPLVVCVVCGITTVKKKKKTLPSLVGDDLDVGVHMYFIPTAGPGRKLTEPHIMLL